MQKIKMGLCNVDSYKEIGTQSHIENSLAFDLTNTSRLETRICIVAVRILRLGYLQYIKHWE